MENKEKIDKIIRVSKTYIKEHHDEIVNEIERLTKGLYLRECLIREKERMEKVEKKS